MWRHFFETCTLFFVLPTRSKETCSRFKVTPACFNDVAQLCRGDRLRRPLALKKNGRARPLKIGVLHDAPDAGLWSNSLVRKRGVLVGAGDARMASSSHAHGWAEQRVL